MNSLPFEDPCRNLGRILHNALLTRRLTGIYAKSKTHTVDFPAQPHVDISAFLMYSIYIIVTLPSLKGFVFFVCMDLDVKELIICDNFFLFFYLILSIMI